MSNVTDFSGKNIILQEGNAELYNWC